MGIRLTVWTVSCVAALGMFGCGSSGSDKAPPAGRAVTSVPPASGRLVDDGTFRFALGSDPGSLDYANNSGVQVLQLNAFAYDGLVASLDGKKIVSNLAEEWTVSPRAVTFMIRDGVTCSDGSPVTPSVIAKSFDYYKKPTVQSPIFGDVTDWRVRGDDATGTVKFTFGKPVGFPLQSLANVPVVCGKGLEDRKLLKRQTSGSGPYVLTRSVPNDVYVLARREGYTWGPDGATTAEPGMPKTVELRVVQDPSTTVNILLSGGLDGAPIPGSQAERLGNRARTLATPSEIAQAWFNHLDGRPTADPNVRRALLMALDREAMATVARGQVASNMVPPFTNPCPDPANASAIPAHNPSAAAKLLDQAGWAKGPNGTRAKDGRPVKLAALIVSGGTVPGEWAAAAELAVRAWRELGIDVETRTLSATAYVDTVVSGDWDALPVTQINVDTPANLTGFLSGPPPPNGSNLTRIRNAAYDRGAEQALNADTPEAGCREWNAAERALYQQVDIVPLFSGDQLWAMDDRTDYRVTSYGVVPTTVRMHTG
jgi:peptide/nickel transport system substrate-binding protein